MPVKVMPMNHVESGRENDSKTKLHLTVIRKVTKRSVLLILLLCASSVHPFETAKDRTSLVCACYGPRSKKLM